MIKQFPGNTQPTLGIHPLCVYVGRRVRVNTQPYTTLYLPSSSKKVRDMLKRNVVLQCTLQYRLHLHDSTRQYIAYGRDLSHMLWTKRLSGTNLGYCGCPQEGGEGGVTRPLWRTMDQQQCAQDPRVVLSHKLKKPLQHTNT